MIETTADSLASNNVFCGFCPGFCCYKLKGSTLYITAEDINRIARHLQISDGQVRKSYLEGKNTFKIKNDNSCIFLADGKISKRCSIHQARPKQCMDFPYNTPCPYVGSKDLLTAIEPLIIKSLNLK